MLFHWNIRENLSCECGAEKETIQHIVKECSLRLRPHYRQESWPTIDRAWCTMRVRTFTDLPTIQSVIHTLRVQCKNFDF
jgi:hypothetical protein